MPKNDRDARLRNSRPTRQQRIDDKCYSCDKWTLHGKTCKDGCDKE